MERLTYWNERKQHYDWHCENNVIADKLAAYEDAEKDERMIILPVSPYQVCYMIDEDEREIQAGFFCDKSEILDAIMSGEDIYKTSEEAEAALAVMEEK